MKETLPKPFGRYILEERIAVGGMAEVFRATTRKERFEKEVCIKRILPHLAGDENFNTMFRDEAALVAQLSHANIIQVFDFGEEEGSLFLVMEFVDGADLRQILKQANEKKQKLSVAEVLTIGKDVCLGLHHAHIATSKDKQPLNLVHRDISPHNILISRNGEVKVMDFGIALGDVRETLTQTGAVKGKSSYMSPEQAGGARNLDHRTDQYATGIVLWEMLANKKLFGRDQPSHVALMEILKGDIEPLSAYRDDVPDAVEAIIIKALSLKREDRFENMKQLHAALNNQLFRLTSGEDVVDIGNLVARFDEDTTPISLKGPSNSPPKFENAKTTQDIAAGAMGSAYSSEFAKNGEGETAQNGSAYGSLSAIIRTAEGEKYAEKIADLERKYPFKNFSDLVERFPALRDAPGARPWDPFLLLSSITGVAPEVIAGDNTWTPPTRMLLSAPYQAAAFMVNTFMKRAPTPASDDVKNLWDADAKAAYMSVFKRYQKGEENFSLEDLVSEFEEVTRTRGAQ
ncbi:MAG: serine/threonine protein kinase [Deltaproteobacteria bacterium]|nr:serine/threonine protein kinase [Deltaproteobacteria bacterium]